MNKHALFAAALFALTGLASAQTAAKAYRAEQRFTIVPGGTVVIENPLGNIEVVGGDGTEIEATTLTTITGNSSAAIEDGHRHTANLSGGDERTRILKTAIPAARNGWDATVDWNVKVPRATHVTVLSQTSRRIGVMNISGNVHVKNFSGTVVIYNVAGETVVESVNGSIVYNMERVGANAVLSSINGHVTGSVPADADFQWVAETAKGDIRTNLPTRGAFSGNVYRGTVNGPSGVTITTLSLMGNVYLLANGQGVSGAQSVKPVSQKERYTPPQPKQTETFKGFFRYYTNLGDVEVPGIDGDVDIYTGAGKVFLGNITGACKVFSKGGPLEFGTVSGQIEAVTQAGDVTIERARRGGTVTTRGGTIRVLYMNAPMHLVSGGGDILVRRTTAPVNAQTTSGDITVGIDKGSATERVDAKTEKGNVIVHVGVNFAAEVDATILTSDPDSDTIVCDLPGLAITREQVGGKTRVHATGKLNGGGERLTLEATEGDIRITTAPAPVIPRKK